MEPTKELKPQDFLSPSSIMTYLKCPREYYYTYILKLPIVKNIHLIKGTIVHTILEEFFKDYKDDFQGFVKEELETKWESRQKELKSLGLDEETLLNHKQDALNMLTTFAYTFEMKVNNLITTKAKDKQHAFNLLRPKFRELKLENPNLHIRGYIDRVYESFSGATTITDYKTSHKYGTGMPEDYKLQLSLYCLMYYKETNVMPNYASLVFLRYGEEVMLEITPSLIKSALDVVNDVWNKTRSTDIKDYPMKETTLCGWCSFKDKCNGLYDHEKEQRKKQILGIDNEKEYAT